MDKNKIQGKIREQMNRELKARREFNAKWRFMADKEINKFYDQTYLNSKVNETNAKEEVSASTRGEGETMGEQFFTSKVMFDAMNLCRCGRKKQGPHLTKCLQKCIIQYSEGEAEAVEDPDRKINIPRTTNAIHGFFPCKYLNLERSTYHITTKANLKHKITDQVYENIIIG